MAALAALSLVCGPALDGSRDRAAAVVAADDVTVPAAVAGAPSSSGAVWTGPLPIRPSRIVMVVAGGAGVPSADSAPVGPPGASGALGIPLMVLRAYHLAADRLALEQPSCGLPWWLLAGIGHTESGHAESGRLTADGTTRGRILGPRLNGGIAGDAVITDTDHGRYDGDPVYDRAVGPMQFIPATWVRWGADGNGDGKRDPNNIFDATLAAGRYLCAGGRQLSTPAGLRSAVLSYNHSLPYLATVLAWGAAYRDGASALPDSSLRVIADVTKVRPPVSSRPPRRASGPIRLLATNSTAPASSSAAPSTSPAPSTSGSSCLTSSPTATGAGSSSASSSAASSSVASSSAASSSAASSSAASSSAASSSAASSSASGSRSSSATSTSSAPASSCSR